jgi:hypothetical protein
MDALITAAARALASGDPLAALNRVALRGDAHALALRGIAMAQLGDFVRAKTLMRKAARAFGRNEAVARARCEIAEAEIALAARELSWSAQTLTAARATLEAHGDHVNAAHAGYLETRRLLLIGKLDDAQHALAELAPLPLPPALRAAHELVVAGIATRRLQAAAARAALARAEQAARRAGIPALSAEVETALRTANAPAGRLIARGEARLVSLDDVEALVAPNATTLVVDACRRIVRIGSETISLTTRPVLFVLARLLGQGWPDDVPRNTLIAQAFRVKTADESHRARLRVEIGRLRTMLRSLADIRATQRGFLFVPHRAAEVAVLDHPAEEKHAALLALLADGESWSSSALALALGESQRNVQRTLESLADLGKVRSFGRGPARRWSAPVAGFATPLLLPAPFVND